MKLLAYLLMTLALMMLFTPVLMWMINYVFSPTLLVLLFGVPQIGLGKAFFLSIITGCLFKSGTGKID
jgi:hypothetical protein